MAHQNAFANTMALLLFALPWAVVVSVHDEFYHEHLGVADSSDNSRWMSVLPDHTLIKDMSIPGSHDTLTAYGYFSYDNDKNWPTKTICNDKPIPELLQAGIRSLDFRFTEENELDFYPDEGEADIGSLTQYFEDSSSAESPLRLKSDVRLGDVFPSIAKRFPSAADSRGALLVSDYRAFAKLRQEMEKFPERHEGTRDPDEWTLEERLNFLLGVRNGTDVRKQTWTFRVKEKIQKGRHGASLLGSTFPIDLVAAFTEVQNFLSSNDREFVLVSVKNEMKNDFPGFSRRVLAHLKASFPSLMYDWQGSKPSTNSAWGNVELGALRGKVVFMSSDEEEDGYGRVAEELEMQNHYLLKSLVYPASVRCHDYKQKEAKKKIAEVRTFFKLNSDLKDGTPTQAYAISLNINPASHGKMGALFGKELWVLAKPINAEITKWLPAQVKAIGLMTFDFPLRDSGPALVQHIIDLNR